MSLGDLGVSGLAIQEWLDRHKRVLGTRRVSGNSLVVQAASITTCDQPLHFFDSANFALIRCTAALLQACTLPKDRGKFSYITLQQIKKETI